MTGITKSTVFSLLPRRSADSHKGNYGKLLILAGSTRYRGCAQLATAGALRCGAGIVTLAATERVISAAACNLPEALLLPLPEDPDGSVSAQGLSLLQKTAASQTAIAAGCGLTCADGPAALIRALIALPVPLVLDADGLNLVASDPGALRWRAAPTLLTPHPGEMARLCGCSTDQIQHAREDYALSLARQTGCVVLLKGHGSLIADPDGGCRYNPTGGPGLARGGSGDLLTGMAGAFLAQGLSAREAAICAAWLHGAAADACAERRGILSMLPHDLLDDLCSLLANNGF